MFDKAVFLTIFSSVTHSDCLLFVHFLAARRHGGPAVESLSFTVCVIGCLARYHQVTVHTAGLPGFHNTPGVGPFYILGIDRWQGLSRYPVLFSLFLMLFCWVHAVVLAGTDG